jgi:hypothetical protein
MPTLVVALGVGFVLGFLAPPLAAVSVAFVLGIVARDFAGRWFAGARLGAWR